MSPSRRPLSIPGRVLHNGTTPNRSPVPANGMGEARYGDEPGERAESNQMSEEETGTGVPQQPIPIVTSIPPINFSTSWYEIPATLIPSIFGGTGIDVSLITRLLQTIRQVQSQGGRTFRFHLIMESDRPEEHEIESEHFQEVSTRVLFSPTVTMASVAQQVEVNVLSRVLNSISWYDTTGHSGNTVANQRHSRPIVATPAARALPQVDPDLHQQDVEDRQEQQPVQRRVVPRPMFAERPSSIRAVWTRENRDCLRFPSWFPFLGDQYRDGIQTSMTEILYVQESMVDLFQHLQIFQIAWLYTEFFNFIHKEARKRRIPGVARCMKFSQCTPPWIRYQVVRGDPGAVHSQNRVFLTDAAITGLRNLRSEPGSKRMAFILGAFYMKEADMSRDALDHLLGIKPTYDDTPSPPSGGVRRTSGRMTVPEHRTTPSSATRPPVPRTVPTTGTVPSQPTVISPAITPAPQTAPVPSSPSDPVRPPEPRRVDIGVRPFSSTQTVNRLSTSKESVGGSPIDKITAARIPRSTARLTSRGQVASISFNTPTRSAERRETSWDMRRSVGCNDVGNVRMSNNSPYSVERRPSSTNVQEDRIAEPSPSHRNEEDMRMSAHVTIIPDDVPPLPSPLSSGRRRARRLDEESIDLDAEDDDVGGDSAQRGTRDSVPRHMNRGGERRNYGRRGSPSPEPVDDEESGVSSSDDEFALPPVPDGMCANGMECVFLRNRAVSVFNTPGVITGKCRKCQHAMHDLCGGGEDGAMICNPCKKERRSKRIRLG